MSDDARKNKPLDEPSAASQAPALNRQGGGRKLGVAQGIILAMLLGAIAWVTIGLLLFMAWV